MPRFEPFVGLRYSLPRVGSLDDVVCPPYDVIGPDEGAALAARSPWNAVRLEVPEYGGADQPFREAARLLTDWRARGILVRDPTPAFYAYRMRFTGPTGEARCTVGVIGALTLDRAGDADPAAAILPHEHTLATARSDRLALLQATRTNISPIWCLTPATGLAITCGEPSQVAAHTDAEGVEHELWPVTDPDRARAIGTAVASAPVLVADGHHRYATALAYRDEQANGAGTSGGAGAVMALVVELAADQLAVEAIHRLVSGLPANLDPVAALTRWFDLEATSVDAGLTGRMAAAGATALVTRSGAWLARARPATVAAAPHDLDASRLDVALATLPDHRVDYRRGVADSLAAVAAGRADLAVLLRPVTVTRIAAVASGGDRLPPKTTHFTPKPRTGMVLRELDA